METRNLNKSLFGGQPVQWLYPHSQEGRRVLKGSSLTGLFLPTRTIIIEKVLKDTGFDKLPMADRGKEVLEAVLSKGFKPVTEFTGKVMMDHAIPEEAPAFVRPNSLRVGDRVIPLQWHPVGTFGAKFDLPYQPEVVRVKKLYMGKAKVSQDSYPPGRVPADISKIKTVDEDRLWGVEFEPDGKGVEKEAECDGLTCCPYLTKETTMLLRLEPLTTPAGEVL